jgi:ubiquinone/menaquinone biosynthesis C-methylase UbiE
MIPFNHLGWLFRFLGPAAYPSEAVEVLCGMLKTLPEQASLLDLGAGTGVLITFAHECRSDLRFVALDPAEGMLKFAPHYVITHRAWAEELPFGEDAFEAILVGEALHHFNDPEKAVQETVRVLKNGGTLFVYDFDASTFLGKSLCIAEKLLGEPGHFFAPEDLKALLEGYGYAVSVNRHRWRYTLLARLRDE